jgi:hypothetical protein
MEQAAEPGGLASNPFQEVGNLVDNSKFWFATLIISSPFILALFYAGFATANKDFDSVSSIFGLVLIGLSSIMNIIVFVTINNRLKRNNSTFPLRLWTASFILLLVGVLVISFSYKNMYTCNLITFKGDTTMVPSPQ